MFSNARSLWMHARQTVLETGWDTGSRDGACREVLGWSATLGNCVLGWVGGRSRRYAVAEFLWYMSGAEEPWIQHYAPSYARFLNDKGTADGAYGVRWRLYDQLNFVISELTANRESRRAIMTCWDAHVDTKRVREGTKDAPCTLSIQFLIRQCRLHVVATMRSNDVWTGMPYDIFCFTALQRVVASQLGVDVGTYTHQVGSLHLYDRDRDKVLKPAMPADFSLNRPVLAPFVTTRLNELLEFEEQTRKGGVFGFDKPQWPRPDLLSAMADQLGVSYEQS